MSQSTLFMQTMRLNNACLAAILGSSIFLFLALAFASSSWYFILVAISIFATYNVTRDTVRCHQVYKSMRKEDEKCFAAQNARTGNQ